MLSIVLVGIYSALYCYFSVSPIRFKNTVYALREFAIFGVFKENIPFVLSLGWDICTDFKAPP